MNLIEKPFKTRAAALKRSKSAFPGFRGSDDERAVPYAGGFVALVRLAASNMLPVLGDVFEGAKGMAATRRQLF